MQKAAEDEKREGPLEKPWGRTQNPSCFYRQVGLSPPAARRPSWGSEESRAVSDFAQSHRLGFQFPATWMQLFSSNPCPLPLSSLKLFPFVFMSPRIECLNFMGAAS